MNESLNHTSPDAPKLTAWKNEPTLQALRGDVEAAKPSHDSQLTKIRHWNDLLRAEGSAKPKKVTGRSQVQPKLVRRQAEWRYSALSEPFLGSDKLFKVKPVTFEDDKAARQNELVLNWQFRTKLNRVKLIDDYVHTTVDDGTCLVRLGWTRVTKTITTKAPVWSHYRIADQQSMQALQQALDLYHADPGSYETQVPPELKAAVELYNESGQATTAVQTGTQDVKTETVLENRPTVEVMNLANAYIDPSCNGDLDKALFVAITFETNLAELQKEGKRYKNLDRVNWEANTILSQPDHVSTTPTDFNLKDRARKKVVAYEYWGFCDIHGTGELEPIVATWVGETLIRMEASPFPDGKLPFVLVPYLPVKRELYGEPDAEVLGDNQAILGAVTRGMIDLLGRSANSQQGFAKGMLDPLNRRRFENGQDYEFNPNVTPNQGWIQHKFPELPSSAMLMLQLQNQEAEAMTGVKSFSGGISGDSYGSVATGIRGVLDAAAKREMAILRRLAKGMSEIGTKIIAMNAEFLSEEEVIRVTNEEFVTVRREDLKGNFDLIVDISTAEVDNAKSQDLGFMLQTIGPNEDPEMRRLLLAEIAELKRMPALAHKIRTFQPQPDPMQEQLKQLALQKAQAEIMELRSVIALNQAKARMAGAQADRTDLDFVEQESGTNHARDMEKQQAQARGNQDLEVVKALTKSAKEGEKKPDVAAAIGFNHLTDIQKDQREGGGQPAPDPRYNLGSSHFDPQLDPSLNPGLTLTQ